MTDIEIKSILPVTSQLNIKDRERVIQPSIKQIRAIQYFNQGMTMKAALKKAGYSVNAQNTASEFFKRKSVRQYLETMTDHLNKVGLSQLKIAKKIHEFVNAEEIVPVKVVEDGKTIIKQVRVPDYTTQIQGVKLWQGITDRDQEVKNMGNKKREITLTEWINEG